MTRFLFVLVILLIFTINVALSAKGNRTLPETMPPLVIEKVYSSPVGEVQFVNSGERETIFLRTPDNGLCEIDRIEGESACKNFSRIKSQDLADARCVFLFESGHSFCRHRIFSYELKESDLFKVVRSVTASQIENQREDGTRAN